MGSALTSVPQFTCCPDTRWHEPRRCPWHYPMHSCHKETAMQGTFSSCPAL